MPCRKCGCQSFIWNPVSAAQKGWSGSSPSVSGSANSKVVSGTINFQASTLPSQDNKSDQTAYRNCFCGHHYNYHT